MIYLRHSDDGTKYRCFSCCFRRSPASDFPAFSAQKSNAFKFKRLTISYCSSFLLVQLSVGSEKQTWKRMIYACWGSSIHSNVVFARSGGWTGREEINLAIIYHCRKLRCVSAWVTATSSKSLVTRRRIASVYLICSETSRLQICIFIALNANKLISIFCFIEFSLQINVPQSHAGWVNKLSAQLHPLSLNCFALYLFLLLKSFALGFIFVFFQWWNSGGFHWILLADLSRLLGARWRLKNFAKYFVKFLSTFWSFE